MSRSRKPPPSIGDSLPDSAAMILQGRNRHRVVLIGLAVFVIMAFLLEICFGSVRIPPGKVLGLLFSGQGRESAYGSILLSFRLPRACTALLAGSGLAVSGLLMQTLFGNPLAGPFVLGINAGASLGVALVVIMAGTAGLGSFLGGLGLLGETSMALAASLGAAGSLLIVLGAARRFASNSLILILGMMMGYAVSALVSILIHFGQSERVHAFLIWSFGSFSAVSWGELPVLAVFVAVALVLALGQQKNLNSLLLGEDYARSLGVPLRRARLVLLTVAAVLAGVITAFCGPVAFIGIAVPHLCRGLADSSDHQVLVPACALAGGGVALLSDMAAHLPGSSAILPLNAVTSLVGGPLVVWILLRTGGRSVQ